MNITIAGVGAMGSRFALMLHRAGHKVTLIDGWEEHVTAIQKNGLQANLNGEEVVAKLPIYFQSEVDPTLSNDLIILFTKAMQLEAMLADIQPLIRDNTAVLCLLNGIGHEEVIEKYVPRNYDWKYHVDCWYGRTWTCKIIRKRLNRFEEFSRRSKSRTSSL